MAEESGQQRVGASCTVRDLSLSNIPRKLREYFMNIGLEMCSVFGDLRLVPEWVPGSAKHYEASWTRFCGQQFVNENGAQFCSYLVKRVWLGVAFCSRKDFVQMFCSSGR